MFSSTRWMATTGMLLFLFLTLLSAFWLQKKGLTILFCVLQVSSRWYKTLIEALNKSTEMKSPHSLPR